MTNTLFKKRCYYCGWSAQNLLDSLANFEIEHLTPLSRGGSEAPENLVQACRWCNRQKGDKTESEYRMWRLLHPSEATYGPNQGVSAF